jgi:hypothetical protein
MLKFEAALVGHRGSPVQIPNRFQKGVGLPQRQAQLAG